MADAMIPSRIFRSRWTALLWAAGIMWTAYDVAEANRPPAKDAAAGSHDATGEAIDPAALAILANAGG